ncbi:hypothetical protein F5Y16DRAFT_351006 [Xylariaceae sp. FL0255]|nr:hypothetical protein F5Y16DRAFT_351006 [Xylariaceae sp. FL0255]
MGLSGFASVLPFLALLPVVSSQLVESTAPNGTWQYEGCWTDVGRTINAASTTSQNMTAEFCVAFCDAAGYNYAGTEYYDECYCGFTLASGSAAANSTDCNTPCDGNSTEACGGPNRLSLFYNPYISGPQPNTGIPNWPYIGCYVEGTTGRALTYGANVASSSMSGKACTAACQAQGYILAGTEYSGECYCGNSFSNGGGTVATDGCNMKCNGNSSEICGGANRLNVYDYKMEFAVTTNTIASSTTTTTNKAPTTTTTPGPTTTTVVAATGIPKGWTSQGCWQDGPNGRILSTYQAPDNDELTVESCVQLCASMNYTISGTEYYQQCFCGNAIYNGGYELNSTAECNTPCTGDSTEMCGGSGYLAIISDGTPQVYEPPTTQLSGLNGTWTYQGCYVDNLNNTRTLPWQVFQTGYMTATTCLYQCGLFGYAAAGLEYGDECYCGDPIDVTTAGSTPQPITDCNVVCAGNASSYCGGGSRLSMYYWTGSTPLYNFHYPAGNNAGTYSNLVGGVVTPLITMQSITGKVTFLEKWGTGAPNSTGAYELDLSEISNFTAAWRTLHLKTDVFCSAGLILPDKAGRQLTVGGWSLESTYGVRLYWPDGSAGVPGTNDWQENVDELSLVRGRWYPSAMIMANGSILVVGGEVGSNSAPEPTLELLPSTGTYLYMDWLERTDPNNLYPFLSVLPGGGIYVGYWNEARILDEVTFETIKVLPNITGSVADPTAGRTYPLEGASVLLPQYAPYTDPLGVLMCGGSTIGTGYALDNCVSIYPEAANPEWVLERMPSKRVMSCMAPLPDGTYLIANGAMQGVAGFGLATDPNLNALLYDPSQPIGSRISVMANTSVARLYHSEAITLLDGRVLITGSDPEDGVHPEEIRVEVFTPPYLYSSLPRPSFTVANNDWSYGESVTLTLGSAASGTMQASLLGAVASTHGNSMGARTLFPAVSCSGTSCTVTAPPNAHICPPGWYQLFVLQNGIPAVGTYVRIGGDPAELGNWPDYPDFTIPGV